MEKQNENFLLRSTYLLLGAGKGENKRAGLSCKWYRIIVYFRYVSEVGMEWVELPSLLYFPERYLVTKTF